VGLVRLFMVSQHVALKQQGNRLSNKNLVIYTGLNDCSIITKAHSDIPMNFSECRAIINCKTNLGYDITLNIHSFFNSIISA
jgi:hypothetical protein